MEVNEMLSLLASTSIAVAFFIYVIQIKNSFSRVPVVSFFIWTVLAALHVVSYIGVSIESWTPVMFYADFGSCALAFVVVLASGAYEKPTRQDHNVLALCLIAIALWICLRSIGF